MLPVQGQVPAKLSEEASAATEGIRDERVCEVLELCPRPKAICSESKTKTKKCGQSPGQAWSELLAACCFG